MEIIKKHQSHIADTEAKIKQAEDIGDFEMRNLLEDVLIERYRKKNLLWLSLLKMLIK